MATIQSSIKLTDGMTPALQSMNKALNIVLNSFESMQRASGKAIDTKEIQAARQELAKSQVYFNNIEREINENRVAQDRFNNSVQNASGATSGLLDKIKDIATAYVGFKSVKSIVSASDAYTSNVARIDLMNDGLQTTAELQQKIYEASQRSLTSYGDMSSMVAKLGITASHAFGSNDEIVAFSELLNKQFALAGTGRQEKSAAMYQLTQAMASGKLQGDEFRSILENAPMLAQTIAKHMGMTLGQLREVSSEGKITADVIKKALLNPEAVKKVNDMFANMPMTWADLWTQMTNKVNKGLEPLYIKLRDMWNNPKVQTFLDGLVNGFLMLTSVGIHVFEILSSGFSLIYDNWGYIESILIGIATAYLPTIIGLLWAKVTALWAMIPPLFTAASAWLALNWHIVIIAAAVAGVVLWVRHLGVTFSDVIGFISGVVMAGISIIVNTFVYMYNTCLHIIDSLANVGITAGEILYNAFHNGFTGWIAGVQSALWSFVSWAYGIIKPLIEVWDKVKGTDYANSLQTKIDKNIEKGTTSNYTKFNRSNLLGEYGMDTMSVTGSYQKGFDWGSGIGDKMGDLFSSVTDKLGFDADSKLGSLGKDSALDKIAKNTGAIAKNTSVDASQEDLSYMRDMATRQAIDRHTTRNVTINMTNNNNISKDADADSLLNKIQKVLYEETNINANGVHY